MRFSTATFSLALLAALGMQANAQTADCPNCVAGAQPAFQTVIQSNVVSQGYPTQGTGIYQSSPIQSAPVYTQSLPILSTPVYAQSSPIQSTPVYTESIPQKTIISEVPVGQTATSSSNRNASYAGANIPFEHEGIAGTEVIIKEEVVPGSRKDGKEYEVFAGGTQAFIDNQAITIISETTVSSDAVQGVIATPPQPEEEGSADDAMAKKENKAEAKKKAEMKKAKREKAEAEAKQAQMEKADAEAKQAQMKKADAETKQAQMEKAEAKAKRQAEVKAKRQAEAKAKREAAVKEGNMKKKGKVKKGVKEMIKEAMPEIKPAAKPGS